MIGCRLREDIERFIVGIFFIEFLIFLLDLVFVGDYRINVFYVIYKISVFVVVKMFNVFVNMKNFD